MMTSNQTNPNLLHLQNTGSIFFERVFSFQWRGRRERFRWYRKSGLPFISVVSTDQNCQMFRGGPFLLMPQTMVPLNLPLLRTPVSNPAPYPYLRTPSPKRTAYPYLRTPKFVTFAYPCLKSGSVPLIAYP